MTRHIICMLVKGAGDHDLYESSGALFHKLAFQRKRQSVLLLRFSGEDYRAWSNQPSRVLRSQNYTVGDANDSGVALYINAHAGGSRIAGGKAGEVAAAIIEAIDLEDTRIEKLVFLACSMSTSNSFEPDMGEILDSLAGYDIWKIVLYTSPMTIFSVRNLKLRDTAPAKGATKAIVEEHFKLLDDMEYKFFADLVEATGNEEMVTVFYHASLVGNDKKLWGHPQAEARTSITVPAKDVREASGAIRQMHDKEKSEWGHRLVIKGKEYGFLKSVDALQFEHTPFTHFAAARTQAVANVSSANGRLSGPVKCDTSRNKVVWERRSPTSD